MPLSRPSGINAALPIPLSGSRSRFIGVSLSAFSLAIILPFVICHSSFGQGVLTPVGPPAPTMKSLDQIEARTPISSAPYTITNPGSYYLTTNLTVSTSNAITIAANQVTLDLNGFAISSTSPTPSGAGVMIGSERTNISIFNGSIVSGVSEANGVFSGTGFDSGINVVLDLNNTNTYGLPFNVHVSNISVSGCLNYGILLYPEATVVDSCTVRTAGNDGIYASLVRNSLATDCGGVAILCYEASHCEGQSVGSNRGIEANYSADNCYGYSAGETGLFSSGVAQNCYGSSASSAVGLYANFAENCYGYSASGTGLRATASAVNCGGLGFSEGLEADNTAENCYGRANTNGTGVLCYNVANNCYGYCPAGNSPYSYGVSAGIANNCYGQHDGGGWGLYAGTANCCGGRGNTYYGLGASIGIGCSAYRASGTPAYTVTYKYNMP